MKNREERADKPLERDKRFELSLSAWKADVLPLTPIPQVELGDLE